MKILMIGLLAAMAFVLAVQAQAAEVSSRDHSNMGLTYTHCKD